ncbi:MAG: translational machinery protein [Polyangiaceae bacterium]|jgi:stalled ribosome rescue protein Dom34
MPKYVAVWLDHREARIFHIDPYTIDEKTVLAPLHNIHHKHPVGPEGVHEHPEDAKRFFHEVAQALDGAGEVLVLGPGSAKHELVKYVHEHDRALEPRVVGVETVDHPTDRQLAAFATKYFVRSDRTQ